MAKEKPVRIVFLGDSGVGKTSVVCQTVNRRFDFATPSTIGIDFYAKSIMHNGQEHYLQFWDTAGTERFSSVMKSYIRGARIAIIVYDICDLATFERVEFWFTELQMVQDDAAIWLVGNKSDLALDKRKVSFEEGEARATSFGAEHFLEVSAKFAENCDELMEQIKKFALKEFILPKERGGIRTERMCSAGAKRSHKRKQLEKSRLESDSPVSSSSSGRGVGGFDNEQEDSVDCLDAGAAACLGLGLCGPADVASDREETTFVDPCDFDDGYESLELSLGLPDDGVVTRTKKSEDIRREHGSKSGSDDGPESSQIVHLGPFGGAAFSARSCSGCPLGGSR